MSSTNSVGKRVVAVCDKIGLDKLVVEAKKTKILSNEQMS
jgi:hypothetical protein